MLFLKSISNLCGSTPWPLSPDIAAYVELLQAGQFSMVAQGAMWIWQVSFPSCKTGVVTACWAGHTLLSPRSTLSPERLIATTCTLWSFCLLTLGWVCDGRHLQKTGALIYYLSCPYYSRQLCISLCPLLLPSRCFHSSGPEMFANYQLLLLSSRFNPSMPALPWWPVPSQHLSFAGSAKVSQ